MTIDVTQIILAVITLLSAIVTGFLIPLLRSKLGSEESKLSESQIAILKAVARTGVFAAEQIYNSDEGQKKKSYVLELLRQQGFDVDLSAVDAAIEAAVKELKIEIGE